MSLPKDFELSKMSLNYAAKRELGVDYYIGDFDKDDEVYHIVWIYLDLEDCSDASIGYKVKDWKNGEFFGEFWFSHYSNEADAIIEKILPKSIHGEVGLRKALKILGEHRAELIELV